jgi:hypothetical protein
VMLPAKQSSASSVSSAVFLGRCWRSTAEDAEDAEEERDCKRTTLYDRGQREGLLPLETSVC